MFQAFLPPLGGDRLRLAARILTVLQPVFLVLGRAVADWSLGICVVLFLIHSFRNRDGAWLRERWVQASLLLWGWLFIVALGAHDPGAAFVHAAGWIRFPLFAAAIVFWIMDRDWLRFFLIVTGATLVFVACDTLLQYVVGQDLFGNPISDAHRLTGPFPKKMVGIYLARLAFLPLIPVFAAAVAARRKGLIAVVGGAGLVVFLAVLLSGERMATLSLLLGLALLPFLTPSPA
ncbi:MAG: hypothetical protein HGA90_07505 [Alphaproteobacteria bacterium]|nr:hypothetical protein [Alphaproteobacteria bacterium]